MRDGLIISGRLARGVKLDFAKMVLVKEVALSQLASAKQVLTKLKADVVMRTSIPLLHPQPLLLYILDQLLELAHAN